MNRGRELVELAKDLGRLSSSVRSWVDLELRMPEGSTEAGGVLLRRLLVLSQDLEDRAVAIRSPGALSEADAVDVLETTRVAREEWAEGSL